MDVSFYTSKFITRFLASHENLLLTKAMTNVWNILANFNLVWQG